MPGPLAVREMKRSSAARDGSISPPLSKRKQISQTTQSAVVNFFTPISQKEPEKTTWRTVNESLLVARYKKVESEGPTQPQKRRRIAGFDFDSTIVKSASGTKFGRDASDWKWWHSSVPETLRNLQSEGYQLVVFSNQGGISLKSDSKSLKSDQRNLTSFKGKVTAVLNQLDLPISVYAATGKDKYRKPRAGMWEEMLEDYDLSDSSVDLEGSFFVGDAAGRPALTWGDKDFSCSDRDFAMNIGIQFHTPDELFLKESPKSFTRDFDPALYLTTPVPTSTEPNSSVFSKANPIDILLFCGCPGAGKSTFYWRHVEPLGYERVNQDTLKTRERCIQTALKYLAEGKAVAIDNTNADSETRAVWVRLAQKHEVPIRCIWFTAPPLLCLHNDTVRALGSSTLNPEKRTILPKVAFTGFSARFREPTLKEGFSDIVKIDFYFEGTDTERAVWGKYWI